MKAKEHTRQVRDKVVEKFKAVLGYKKYPKLSTSHRALFNPSSENGKRMAQLQRHCGPPKLTGRTRRSFIRKAAKRPMVTLEEL